LRESGGDWLAHCFTLGLSVGWTFASAGEGGMETRSREEGGGASPVMVGQSESDM
jgi:hypothetical protein